MSEEDLTGTVDVDLMLNGDVVGLSVRPDERLVDTLRFRLGLGSVRESCGIGVCGSCTVIVDDSLSVSGCLTLTAMMQGRSLRTAEGLGSDAETAALQEAFIDAKAFQCSFCTPGMILAASLSSPEDEVEETLAGNLCRCGAYPRIRNALQMWFDGCAEKE